MYIKEQGKDEYFWVISSAQEWVLVGGIERCPNCGGVHFYDIDENNPDVLNYFDCKFCPHCGIPVKDRQK